MEDDDAAWLKLPGKSTQQVGCVSLKQQYVPTDDSIERLLESHLGSISFAKKDVAQRLRVGSSTGRSNRGGRPVNTDNRALVTDQFRSQKRDVAATAAYVKDAHPGREPGIDEKFPGDRSYVTSLRAQALEFPLRVAEHVLRR